MTSVSIIGTGNMGQAIAGVAGRGGHSVQLIGHTDDTQVTGDIVVLAVPYPALSTVLAERADSLAGRIVVDITNPLDFETFDSLTVPADSSAAAEVAAALPGSRVLKAFNTTFAGTLAAGAVGPLTTTVRDRRGRRRRQVDAGRRDQVRRPAGHRRRLSGPSPRARGPRLPADHARRHRQGLLDRRLRRDLLTAGNPNNVQARHRPGVIERVLRRSTAETMTGIDPRPWDQRSAVGRRGSMPSWFDLAAGRRDWWAGCP
jgi:hypothetical protein